MDDYTALMAVPTVPTVPAVPVSAAAAATAIKGADKGTGVAVLGAAPAPATHQTTAHPQHGFGTTRTTSTTDADRRATWLDTRLSTSHVLSQDPQGSPPRAVPV